MRRLIVRSGLLTLVGSALLIGQGLFGPSMFGQEPANRPAAQPARTPAGQPRAEGEKSAPAAEARPTAARTPAAPRGRLPALYARVVTPSQREQIYAIQQKYAEDVKRLEAELAAVRQKMQQEVEGVLSPEQQEELKKLQGEAQAAAEARRRASGGSSTSSARPGAAEGAANPTGGKSAAD